MRDKDTEWVTKWKKNRGTEKNKDYITPELESKSSASANGHKASYYGEVLRTPEQLCHRDPYFQYSFSHSIQTTVSVWWWQYWSSKRFSSIYSSMWAFTHSFIRNKITFIQSHRRDYSLKANNKPQQSHFVCHLKKNQCHFFSSCM